MAGDVKESPDGWERPSRGIVLGEVRGESLVDELAMAVNRHERDGGASTVNGAE